LDEYRANASDAPGAEWTAHNIHRIVDLNTLDVALYYQAKVLFSTRVRKALRPVIALMAPKSLSQLFLKVHDTIDAD
jgi:hypothetical protein